MNLNGNIWRYYAFESLWGASFFVPVIVLFWGENGLDAFDIYVLQGLFAVAVVLLEVPTGMVADRIGKRTSLLYGAILLTLGFAVYSLGTSFAIFLVGEVVLALGVTFISGADTALLYDTLTKLGRKEEYRRIEGRARGLQMATAAAYTVVGGLVGAWSTRATLALSALGPLVGIFIVLGLVEASPPAPAASGAGPVESYLRLIADSLRFVRRHRLVLWYMVFLATLSGTSTWLLWLYQPYMEWSGLPVWSFGIAFAVFNLFAAFASHSSQRFGDALGPGGTLVALGALHLLPLPLLALVVSPASCMFILGQQAVRGLSGPIISDRILRYTFADKRATVLSLAALCGRLVFAVTAPAVGYVANVATMPESLLFQAAVLLLFLLLLVFLYRRISAKYFVVKEKVVREQ